MIPTLFLVILIVFFSLRFIPGDVVDLMVSEMSAEASIQRGQAELTAEIIEHAPGLDVPVHIQYGRWLGKAVQGDLGNSLWKGTPVTEEILHFLPVSVELGLIAITTSLLIALPIGVYSAIRQDTGGDYFGLEKGISSLHSTEVFGSLLHSDI